MTQAKKRRRKDARRVVEEFLSCVVEDEGADMKDRLKASELLSKAAAPEQEKPTQLSIRIDYGDAP